MSTVRCAKSKTENFSAESSVCFAIQQACTEGMQLHEKLNSVQAQRGASSVVFSTWNESLMSRLITQHILPHHLICVNSTVRRGSFCRLWLAEERALHLACQQSSVQEDVSMPRSRLLEGCITVSTENKLLTLDLLTSLTFMLQAIYGGTIVHAVFIQDYSSKVKCSIFRERQRDRQSKKKSSLS